MSRPEVHRVDEGPTSPVKRSAPPSSERHLVRRSRVAAVGLESVPRVVLSLERHHAISGDFGEHGGSGDCLRARVPFDDHPDRKALAAVVQEIELPVDEQHVRCDVEPVERSMRRESLCCGHAELVTLVVAGVTDCPGRHGTTEWGEERLSFRPGELLRVADSGRDPPARTGRHHDHTDAHRSCPGAAPYFVDTCDCGIPLGKTPTFDP